MRTKTTTVDLVIVWINNETVAAGRSIAPARWSNAFAELTARIADRFARWRPAAAPGGSSWDFCPTCPARTLDHRRARRGAHSHGMQHLPAHPGWNTEGVRADIVDYVTEHLHDEHAVLVVEEAGDLKKGRRTVGVQRQYTRTAGRIENSRVAVYLAYASRHGHAAVDRELYLPCSWSDRNVSMPTHGKEKIIKQTTKRNDLWKMRI